MNRRGGLWLGDGLELAVCRACALEELLSRLAGVVVVLEAGRHALLCEVFAGADLPLPVPA